MIKKFYELDEWEKVNHWDWILTFNKIDWAYAHWTDEEWRLIIWHAYEYEFRPELWYYIPVNSMYYTAS